MTRDMKHMIRAFAIVTITVFSLGARAQEQAQAPAPANCLDASVVDQLKSALKFETAGIDSFDRCAPDTHTYKMMQAMELIRTLQFSSRHLSQPYNQDILPTDFWGYFSQRANTVHDEDSCQDGVVAFVYGMEKDGIVHICPLFYDPHLSKFERAETLLHEVRHFEGYTHVTCTRGPREGMEGACDESVEEKGSYAVTVESLAKMSLLDQNATSVEKAMTKSTAIVLANQVFNEPIRPRDLKAIYLADQNGHQAYMYSDAGVLPISAITDGQVISRDQALAVFPKDHSDAYTADVFEPNLSPLPALGTFSETYNSTPQAQRPDVVDIMNLDYLSASITTHEIEGALRGATAQTKIALPWNLKAAYSAQEVGVDDQNNDALYVVNDQNKMFRVQLTSDDPSKYNIEPIGNPLGDITQVAIFNDTRLGLGPDGQVLVDQFGRWQPYEPLKNLKVAHMTRPFMWDQYFEDVTSPAIQ